MFKPINDLIMVIRDTPDAKTPAGIFLPEGSQDKPNIGTVVALGTGVRNQQTGAYDIPFSVTKGARIVFNSYAGTEITADGRQVVLIHNDDILGVDDGVAQPTHSEETQ